MVLLWLHCENPLLKSLFLKVLNAMQVGLDKSAMLNKLTVEMSEFD